MKIMRKIIWMLILSAVALGARAEERTDDSRTLWERAGRLYAAGDYNGAVATYDSIVNQGWESAELYYNLGCANFKAGKNGKAILNYHRAQRIDPSNENVRYNLAYAETLVKDKIDAVPEFAAARWMRGIKNLFGVNTWGVMSLVALGVALAALLFYLLAQKRHIRKAGFVVALLGAVVFLLSVSLGGSLRRSLLDDNQAVVLSTAAVVKAAPEKSSKDLFILHEGTCVELLDSFGEWSEIRIADGNEGWIRTSSIEII